MSEAGGRDPIAADAAAQLRYNPPMAWTITRFANPGRFLQVSQKLLPWCGALAALLILAGLSLALFVAPADYQQGEAMRIMYVHVPSAWMALNIYLFLAVASGVALVAKHPLADLAAQAAAPIGAAFTLVCLVSGSLWGRPMWGAWWVWDARLTSVLVLFFLYLGYMALADAFDDASRGARAAALLALVGAVNLPIIKFSVDWWNTLHQPASVMRFGGPAIYVSMLLPLLVMTAGFTTLFLALLLLRMRTLIFERRARALRLNGRLGLEDAARSRGGDALSGANG